MLKATNSPEQRRASRRARRWQRRARIAAPFLVVPVMLGLLVLSVDLIEYHPTGRTDRAEVPTHSTASTPRATQAESMAIEPQSVLSVSVVDATRPETTEQAAAAPQQTAIPGWPSVPPSPTTR